MRLIDADKLLTKEHQHYHYSAEEWYVTVRDIEDAPTIEPDWNEMLVICDNCGHAIHVKRTDVKPIIEPERKKPEWIPCSEKLPEPYEDVLISTSQNRIQLGWIDEDDEWIITSLHIDNDEVLAWMPIPEPYKEEKGDAEIH